MDITEVNAVLSQLMDEYGALPTAREEIRVWNRSGVERLHLGDGTSVVFKYAEGPFANEHIALGIAQNAGLPVPERLAIVRTPNLLGMLLADLGPAVRDATDSEGAALAVAVHQVTDTGGLPTLDSSQLALMPERMINQFGLLGVDGTALEAAHALDKIADSRIDGAELEPFGFCHSEWHPTSVHVGQGGTHLLDFARAFRGPGLLDLASWYGTVTTPDPDLLTGYIETYIAAGGPNDAGRDRGGLPAALWALGWHRVWAADWFTHQMTIGWACGVEKTWTTAISRHLTEAVKLLNG
ncbi:hypothetical protein AB0395_28105 [Streptosporangium sp. NPDC051023]|uniref:hypothetical protein n=1 Tax=Streptosporangium sp. NPDC051023 TaxID=3155410 RepID=UPI00344EE8A6